MNAPRSRIFGVFVIASALGLACNQLLGTDPGEDPGTSGVDGGSEEGAPSEDAKSGDSPYRGDGTSPPKSCTPPPSDCLDPARADVLEVPSEKSMTQALAEAKAGDTIQLRAGTTAGLIKLPPLVNFRGCAGAKLRSDGIITFLGSGGTVEGLEVYGSIVANKTGSYVVRGIQCLAGGPDAGTGANNEACISATSRDALVAASVELVVEQVLFADRKAGVSAETAYDTMTHEVKLSVKNSLFRDVSEPVRISEGGLVGKITASIAFNTFVRFGSAISIESVTPLTTLRGNLFVTGTRSVSSNSSYALEYSAEYDISMASTGTLVNGAFLAVNPKLDGNLAPDPTSLVVDAITTMAPGDPTDDFNRCPRSQPKRTANPFSDIGAVELAP